MKMQINHIRFYVHSNNHHKCPKVTW